MRGANTGAVRRLKIAAVIVTVAASATGCSYIDDLKAGDRGTWVITVIGAVVLVGTMAYQMGKESSGDDVDPNSSAADPETIRREQTAKAAYEAARSDRRREEAAARARQEQIDAAERAERARHAAALDDERRQRDAAARVEQQRQDAERERIAAAAAAERAAWEQHGQPPKQLRRTFVKTETVQVTDPAALSHAIQRCISNNSGGVFSAGLSPDPPQVNADGHGAAINFFREEWV